MSDNKAIWARAFTTDPRAVKAITGKQYKGNSPKPYWIVERMTDEFGPCGIGWGFTILNERFERFGEHESLHIAVVRLWYVMQIDSVQHRGEFEQVGQTRSSYMSAAGKFIVDEDAPKKSVTDALVKCASYLGFAGDIFSGMWDDSKYVAWAGEEWDRRYQEQNANPRQDELTTFALDLIEMHRAGRDLDAIKAWYSADAWSADNITANEERMHVWGLLKNESELRSAIKANRPEEATA
ncbi:MAG: hypothetical protein ACRC1H_09130 [Caldilineaceae bacterium]